MDVKRPVFGPWNNLTPLAGPCSAPRNGFRLDEVTALPFVAAGDVLLRAALEHHRTQEAALPASLWHNIQDIVLYNGGNIGEGYVFALAADLLIRGAAKSAAFLGERLAKAAFLSRGAAFLKARPAALTAASVFAASAGIVLCESRVLPGIAQIPDWNDIPAGLAGAALYAGLRLRKPAA